MHNWKKNLHCHFEKKTHSTFKRERAENYIKLYRFTAVLSGERLQKESSSNSPSQTQLGFLSALSSCEAAPRVLCPVLCPSLVKDIEVLEPVQRRARSWGRVWRLSPTRGSWGSCGCSAWRRGGSGEALLLPTAAWKEAGAAWGSASDRGRAHGDKGKSVTGEAAPRKVQVGPQEEFLRRKGC